MPNPLQVPIQSDSATAGNGVATASQLNPLVQQAFDVSMRQADMAIVLAGHQSS